MRACGVKHGTQYLNITHMEVCSLPMEFFQMPFKRLVSPMLQIQTSVPEDSSRYYDITGVGFHRVMSLLNGYECFRLQYSKGQIPSDFKISAMSYSFPE